MALVPDAEMPPPPAPITVGHAIDDLLAILAQIRHKLKTLVDWYIYPDIVPSEIRAYDPRLMILHARLKALATIDYQQLPYIIDGSDALASQYLTQIVEQLLNSVHGIQAIFVNHYDRELQERRPFATIWETLTYRDEQLKQVPALSPSNPRRLRPEDLRPNELGNFCRGALELANNRDRGRISFVDKKDLLEENRRKLKAFGGAYLYWECPECAYKVRYHVSNSATSNIHSTDEVREHDGLGIQYRSSFLAKCHLFLPLSEKTSTSSSSPSPFASNTRRDGLALARPSSYGSTYSPSTAKYGCIFCFACGYELERGESAFWTAREFAEHIAREHKRPLPPSLMLHRFLVAVEGKLVDERRRWDLNIL